MVDCGGLENRCAARHQGFESLSLRETAKWKQRESAVFFMCSPFRQACLKGKAAHKKQRCSAPCSILRFSTPAAGARERVASAAQSLFLPLPFIGAPLPNHLPSESLQDTKDTKRPNQSLSAKYSFHACVKTEYHRIIVPHIVVCLYPIIQVYRPILDRLLWQITNAQKKFSIIT